MAAATKTQINDNNQKRSSLPAIALGSRSPVTTPQRRLGDKKQRVSLPTSSALQQAASTAAATAASGTTPPSSPAIIQPQQQQQQPQQQQKYKPAKKLGERKVNRLSLPTSAAVAAAAVAAGTSMSRSDDEEEQQEEQQVATVRRVSNPSNDNAIRKKGLAGNRISNPPEMLAGPGAFFVSGGEVVEEENDDDEDNNNNDDDDEAASGHLENDPNGLDEVEIQVVADDPDIELGVGRPGIAELSRAFSSRPSMRPSFTAQGSAAARLRANVHDSAEDERDEEAQKKGCFSWILNAPWWCNIIVPLIFAGITVASITFLAKSFRRDNNTEPKQENSGTIQVATAAPTVPILNDFFSNETLPLFTIEALNDRNSPQSKAKEWLEKDPNIESYDSARKKQRFALASFFYSTNGARWKDSSNWLSYTAHECLWFSAMNETLEMGYTSDALVKSPNETAVAKTVNCNGDSEYENLLLAADSLRGTIPPEISFLTQLVQISLEGNLIFGEIPSQLDALTKLTSLGLSQNQLESSIPTELYKLSNSLERLYLRSNILTGTLSTQIAQLRKLVALHVTDNQLTGTIPTLLGLLTKLDTLRLGENRYV